jgi:hypothetical protein
MRTLSILACVLMISAGSAFAAQPYAGKYLLLYQRSDQSTILGTGTFTVHNNGDISGLGYLWSGHNGMYIKGHAEFGGPVTLRVKIFIEHTVHLLTGKAKLLTTGFVSKVDRTNKQFVALPITSKHPFAGAYLGLVRNEYLYFVVFDSDKIVGQQHKGAELHVVGGALKGRRWAVGIQGRPYYISGYALKDSKGRYLLGQVVDKETGEVLEQFKARQI